ncbi:hypothetical protein pclt_cds_772 [Pandoravirus celtis]|uniref:Uncharacterized protein n=1 Tax=Pandoravirus celtis TaxID=2568002 RepID=A0A4D6EHS4_9VIRU|nr:hypothetical protein pclt_cds_772 [Pandoravirus celtis]
MADHALDRMCAYVAANDDSLSADKGTPSWRRILCTGVFAVIEADYAEAVVAFLYRMSRALARDPLVTHDINQKLVEHVASLIWDRIVCHDAAHAAVALLILVHSMPPYNGDRGDVWEDALCAIKWSFRQGAWTDTVARTGRLKVYDACTHRWGVLVDVKSAGHYANVDLLRRLSDHVGKSLVIAAAILDGPSTRHAAAAALDWLATDGAFVPTHDQAEHLFDTRPWLAGGRRRLSLLLGRWPHLVEVAHQHSHHMVDSVLDALAADDIEEADCLMEVLDPYAPDPDEGLWPTLLARLHSGGYRQVVDLRIACALATRHGYSPLWQGWYGDMAKPVDKEAVLACANRIGPGALDARAKEELGGLFACLLGHGLLAERAFSCGGRPQGHMHASE